MQSINQTMGVSIRIAKHYIMTNNIVIYHFKNIVSLILRWQAKFKVGVAHKIDCATQRKYRLVNKQNCICSNILVIISVLCMHYEVSKNSFSLAMRDYRMNQQRQR